MKFAKHLALVACFCCTYIVSIAQDDQFHLAFYQFSKGNADLATNSNYTFTVKNPMLKFDWVTSDFGWVTGDFSLVPNIDWGGTVNPPDDIHGALADIDFGFYVNPGKPIKILGSETRIGLGLIGGFETAGFRSAGITFPGASFSILTHLNDRFIVNTRYHYSFFYNNNDSGNYGKNTKLQFNITCKLLRWLGITLTPNIETYKLAERPPGAAANGAKYHSLDLGISFFW
ncbi:MAG: hypothetical protein MUE96_04815 [Bacteroidia bacterium]|jgi:hypothetical protein|nr:hypothetical protein [Bacteroidia bacterium]